MFLEKAADNRKLCFLQCVAFKGSLIADVMLTLFHPKKIHEIINFFHVHVLLYDIFVRYFGMKILFTFLTEKKNLFLTNKKFVYLIFTKLL